MLKKSSTFAANFGKTDKILLEYVGKTDKIKINYIGKTDKRKEIIMLNRHIDSIVTIIMRFTFSVSRFFLCLLYKKTIFGGILAKIGSIFNP